MHTARASPPQPVLVRHDTVTVQEYIVFYIRLGGMRRQIFSLNTMSLVSVITSSFLHTVKQYFDQAITKTTKMAAKVRLS